MQKLNLKGEFMTKLGKEKEEATRVPPKGLRRISVVSLMFFLISFLGWCMETIYCSSWFTDFDDRGFLTLPFCVIYGTPLCLVFLLLGTPKEGFLARNIEKTKLKRGMKIFLRYALYFLLSVGIATLFELVFGLLFDSLGVRLWSYRRHALHVYFFRSLISRFGAYPPKNCDCGECCFMGSRNFGFFFQYCLFIARRTSF